jgi:DNA-binding NtrC family response regulator
MDTTLKADDFIEVRGGSLSTLGEGGQPVGQAVVVGPEPCLVGRGDHCKLVLTDPKVSTSHCEVVATSRGVRITDLGSKNGTYVNQVGVEKSHSVYLTTDAQLRIGDTWLLLRVAGQERVPLSTSGSFGPLVGGSATMRRIFAQLASIAPHDLSVLITGETGTGKELVAEAIHAASRRSDRPFVVVDCTAIPASLAESSLFGHERGAFTGASGKQTSPFVEAEGGTIFLDELGELPLELQPKLLRVLEARKIQSVGSRGYRPIDVRVVAATRRDLHNEMNGKNFRDDLYYRVAQTVVEIPPLRAHPEDIPDLVASFLREDPGAMARIAAPTFERLARYDWPGNVRELRNVVVSAHARSGGGPIEITEQLRSSRSPTRLKREQHATFERDYFRSLTAEVGDNISEMARVSGLSRETVRIKLALYGLGRSR